MELNIVKVEKPDEANVILGQAHFIKTVEDLHEAMVNSVPGIKFGLAFCEASIPALVRASGTSDRLVDLAKTNAFQIGAGHCFIILQEGSFPINVLNAVKMVPEVCHIYCATANPLEVIIAETDQGRAILGVVDGVKSKGIENEDDVLHRKSFLRRIGYKV